MTYLSACKPTRQQIVYVTAAVCLIILLTTTAHAQGVGAGVGNGPGYLSGVIGWIVTNVVMGLIMAAIIFTGVKLLSGRHDLLAIGVVALGVIVITHYAEIAATLANVGGGFSP